MTTEEDIRKIREMMESLFKQNIAEKLNKLTKTEIKIYDLTGEKGQAEIIKILNVSSKTISKVWQKLEGGGLLIKEGTKYRKII